MFLAAVTYLHHHGFDKKVPWYRGEVGTAIHLTDDYWEQESKWNRVRVDLSIDRSQLERLSVRLIISSSKLWEGGIGLSHSLSDTYLCLEVERRMME